MSQSPIELKGSSFTLSVVHLHNSQPEVIRQALQEKVEQAPAFLKNALLLSTSQRWMAMRTGKNFNRLSRQQVCALWVSAVAEMSVKSAR